MGHKLSKRKLGSVTERPSVKQPVPQPGGAPVRRPLERPGHGLVDDEPPPERQGLGLGRGHLGEDGVLLARLFLRLIWLSALESGSLAAIQSVGVCKWESKAPRQPY